MIIRKLALAGGGIKGILHIGMLMELQKHQELDFPDGIYGCSIGSLIAAMIAFRVPICVERVKKWMDFSSWMEPQPSLDDIKTVFDKKGLYKMTKFEEFLKSAFAEVGIPPDAKIGDAYMPLNIIASNITKGIPTIFTKNIPLINALLCSCCIPLLYSPQEMNGELFVDGGLLLPCLSILVPDCVEFYLTKKRIPRITPDRLSSTSSIDYLRQLYSMSMNQFYKFNKTNTVIPLEYPNLYSDSDLQDFDIDKIFEYCKQTLEDFFRTQSA